MKPPVGPSPIGTTWPARKAAIEEKRDAAFGAWMAHLTAAAGNITRAAAAADITKSRGMFLTKSLGLREWAAGCRRANGQGSGRPRGSKTGKKRNGHRRHAL